MQANGFKRRLAKVDDLIKQAIELLEVYPMAPSIKEMIWRLKNDRTEITHEIGKS